VEQRRLPQRSHRNCLTLRCFGTLLRVTLHEQSSACDEQLWSMRWRMRKGIQPEPCPITVGLKVQSGTNDTAVGAAPRKFKIRRLVIVPLIVEQDQKFEVSLTLHVAQLFSRGTGKEETEVPPKADYASLKVQNDIRRTRATGNTPYRVHDLLTHEPSAQVPYFLRQRIFRHTVKSPRLQLLIERLLQKDTVRERVIISSADHNSKKG
ncbi:hypothetical protein ABHI18_012691, partial [Aspergillus niger]